ncbi:glycosyl hydrolase family 61 [Colletotrichum costaricense]|uniref:lytic cellulose monooxygenase (C4-dehydrogenating) n=1 Tax=Colletotrichum costaricense TaxID=1209916 RepID=A0AAI9YH63_9PEZI|nr:glycosyl hydrolase family 61 [Colletotrichum costaricense]KAI3550573.1 glycosyl hydrolase family 61 [Colletotrichum filicis]KAK1509194.1 glycosyl hydrolase family 61 [Colletotrichum costaricense]
MQFSFTAAALATLVGYSAAHTLTIDVWVNGADQGDGRSTGTGTTKYIRSPDNNNPVKDITSDAIVCNVNGAKAQTGFVKAAAGDEFKFEWYHNSRGDDIIDLSHKGPISTWIAPYTEGSGAEAIWTKIQESTYEGGKWAVETLVANKGMSPSVTIPSTLKAGKYLVRQEIIAHHESDTTYDVNPARGAQFYPACAQFEITGTGSDVPPQNFDFTTGYKYTDAGIHFNLYNADASTYKAPGPEVWTGGSGSGSGSSPASSAAPAASSTAAAAATSAAATTTAAPIATSAAAAKPTTLSTAVSSAAPVASSSSAAAPVATPTKAPSAGCKRRRSRKARRSAH